MSEGVWTMPKVTTGIGNDFTFTRQSAAFGTAGILIIGNKAGRIYRAHVCNTAAATAYYLQIHDKATAPVNADIPSLSYRVNASSDLVIDFTNVNGAPFFNGLGVALSTTAGVLTLAAANDISWMKLVYTRNA